MRSSPPRRRHDLDLLRIFACYLLLLFHVAMVFNPAPFYHVRNDEQSFFFLVLSGFISLWHMPLFFLLAGWSTFASLRRRGTSGFLRERARKLALPLIAGCVLLAPGIKYVELRGGLDLNHRGLFVAQELQESFVSVIPGGLPVAEPFDEGFLCFLPAFFSDPDRFTWSHLWFLAYLLAFSLLYLPLLGGLARRGIDARPIGRLWVYAPIAPLALIQLVLRPHWPGPYNLYADWANVSFYSTFLITGFLLAQRPALEAAVEREWKRALAIALATTGVLLLAVLGVVTSPAVLLVGSALAGWCFVVALLGLARTRFAEAGSRRAYFVDSAFPVYLLHQPVIVFLGIGVVALPLGVAGKFVLLLAGSTAVTLALYHFGVRRSATLRFLTGSKGPPPDRRGVSRSSATALLEGA